VPDGELDAIQEQLQKIENILKAESKRRLEANQIMEESILDYLDKLEQQLHLRVNEQFHDLQARINQVDGTLSRIENQFTN